MQGSADPLQDHTLVIPTFNRPELLHKLVAYYAARAPSMSILVLDSSAPEVCSHNRQVIKNDRCKHVTFISTAAIAAKLSDGLSLVRTRYVSFCADDDLVTADGIRNALLFLESNPDYVAAHGIYFNFADDKNGLRIAQEYSGEGNHAKFFGSRLARLCQQYESLFYAVFRTNDAIDIFKHVKNIPSLHYQELFQSAGALIKGKSQRLPCFYGARRMGPAAEPDRKDWQTYYWFAEDPVGLLSQYTQYREALYRFYRECDEHPLLTWEQFVKACDIAHAIYFSAGCVRSFDYFLPIIERMGPRDSLLVGDESLLKFFMPEENVQASRLAQPIRNILQGFEIVQRKQVEHDALKALSRLNQETGGFCRASRACVLSGKYLWLANVPEFREFFRELCAYLEGDAFDRDRLAAAQNADKSQQMRRILGTVDAAQVHLERQSFTIASRFSGQLEHAEVISRSCMISGWAVDIRANCEVREVVATIGASVVARVAPTKTMRDISSQWAPRARRAGFCLSVPISPNSLPIKVFALLRSGDAVQLDSQLQYNAVAPVADHVTLVSDVNGITDYNWTIQNPDRGQRLRMPWHRILTSGSYQFKMNGTVLSTWNFRARMKMRRKEMGRGFWSQLSEGEIAISFENVQERIKLKNDKQMSLRSAHFPFRDAEVVLLREALPGGPGLGDDPSAFRR